MLIIAVPTIFFLALVYFDINTSLQDIKAAAASTNKVHLPGILASQRTLINVENLRRNVETIYNSFDLTSRRDAVINAHALATESVFEPDSRFAEYSASAVALIRSLDAAKSRSDAALDAMEKSKIQLAASAAHLGAHSESGQLWRDFLTQAMQVDEVWVKPNTDQMNQILALCEKPSEALNLGLDGSSEHDIAVECSVTRISLEALKQAERDHTAADQEARSLWKQFDDLLRKLSDLASSAEADLTYRAMEHINTEAGAAQMAFYIACVLIVVILFVFVFIFHRFILAPLAFASRSLQRIRNGGLVDPMPPVRIRELQDMLDILPMLSIYVTELSSRSGLLEQEKDKFKHLSLVDGLTGVGNRRFFDMRLAELGQGHALAMLMIDVDMFKLYNDTYGHQAGDGVLIAVAQALSQTLQRATDQVFRYGGEEFCVLLPDSSEAVAQMFAERMREHVLALQIPHKASTIGPYLTISIGVAVREACSPLSNTTLVERADKALYQAKSQGRNRSVIAPKTV